MLIAAAVAGGWPVYVRPQIDALRHADAIFVLGGIDHDRFTLGTDLAKHGWAPTVVLSTPTPRAPWLTQFCTTVQPRFKVRCVIPDPSTTKGEGRELRRLAAENNWRTVIVVTFRPQISRARYILEQCFDGQLVMVASPTNLSVAEWASQYVYQTAGYVRAAVERGC